MGRYTSRLQSTRNSNQARNCIRSTTAPGTNAGVMIAKVP
jgi:hypothetical protein